MEETGDAAAGDELKTVEVKEGDGVEKVDQSAKEEVKQEVKDAEATGEQIPAGEQVEGEKVPSEQVEGEYVEGEQVQGEYVGGEQVEGEHVEGEHVEGEHMESEQVDGEHMEGEHLEGEHLEGEHAEGEHVEGEHLDDKLHEITGEEMLGEELEGELKGEEEQKEEAQEEQVEEEEAYVEEPPPDPAAPYNFSDSQEELKEPYELRPDQLAEIEQLWEIYMNYTPAYTDLDNYITEKELIYMLKCLMLMTYTPEQLEELIEFCVRPPHPDGHINFEQFKKMVTLRQRDFPIEEELRSALQVFDPEKTGLMDREYVKEVLSKQGHKMPQKQLDNLIKEVDLSNDGTIGIEDVVGTMCIDLNKEDIMMLVASLNPDQNVPEPEEFA